MSRPSLPITGIRCFGGPLRATPLHLTSGLNVLYGLNGAGKSCLLDALRGALAGVSGPYDSLLFLGSRQNEFTAQWSASLDERPVALDQVVLLSAGLIESTQQQPEPQDLALARSIIRQDLMAVRPVGTSASLWEVWLCIDPAFQDAAQEEWHRSRSAVEDLRRLEGAGEVDDLAAALAECRLLPMVSAAIAATPAGTTPDGLLDSEKYRIEDLFPIDGLPVPAALIGHINTSFPAQLMVDVLKRDPSSSMTGWLKEDRPVDALKKSAKAALMGDQIVVDGAGDLTSRAASWAADLQLTANALYQSLLLTAPKLEIAWAPVNQWLWSEPCWWVAEGQRIDQLSHAQTRWAKFSTDLASLDQGTSPLCIILDEPEAALHRAAEAHAALGIASLSVNRNACVVVATHSPDLLDNSTANVIQVTRLDGQTGTRSLDDIGRLSLTELGLLPSDLLGRVRNLLLVEGHHDELVLEGLIGDRLRASRTQILPLRGGAGLKHVVESSFLFNFTEARIIVLLDNLHAAELEDIWCVGLEIAGSQGRDQAIKHVVSSLPGKVDGVTRSENLYIREFLSSALKLGQERRILPLGVEEPDIQHYLPVDRFVPDRTWKDLYEEFNALSKDPDFIKKCKNYKGWLEQEFGSDFSDRNILEAIAAVTSVPNDLDRVACACEG